MRAARLPWRPCAGVVLAAVLLVGVISTAAASLCTASALWTDLCAPDAECAFDYRRDNVTGVAAALYYYERAYVRFGAVAPYWSSAWLADGLTTWPALAECPYALAAGNRTRTLAVLQRYRGVLGSDAQTCPPFHDAVVDEVTGGFSCRCQPGKQCKESIAAIIGAEGTNVALLVAVGVIAGVLLLGAMVTGAVAMTSLVRRFEQRAPSRL
jgi:hypothetical protein